jgi:hypothetical protein
LNLYEIINDAEYAVKCGDLNCTNHIVILDKKEYGDVYREIENKTTFLLVDKKNNINFFVKLEEGFFIEHIINCEPQIFINRDICGPEVVVNFGLDNEFTAFTLELDKKYDLFVIKKLLESTAVHYQYVIQDESGIIKLFSKKIEIGEGFIEKLKYMLEFSYYCRYPRIDMVQDDNREAFFMEVKGELSNLEMLMDIMDDLGKMSYNDDFNVYIDGYENYKIFFSGYVPNIDIIKNKILMKTGILEEGISHISGKAFFRYNKGLIYFSKSPLENDAENGD